MSFVASAAASASIPAPPAPPRPPAPPGGAAGAAAVSAAKKRTPSPADSSPDPAISVMFHLSVDFLDQGWWNGLDGLGMESVIETREEGGNNLWVHQFPTRLKFSNVTLTRPLNEDSAKLAQWFMAMVKQVTRSHTATISAVAIRPPGKGKPRIIASWSLLGVVPVRWKGPSFSVESPKMAVETLELAFHGFGPDPAKGE